MRPYPLAFYTGLEQDQLLDFSNYLLTTLVEGCELALASAINEGKLSAHEAKSSLRYRILLGELSTIQKSLDLLTARQKPNIQEIHSLEKKYRQQVGNRHG